MLATSIAALVILVSASIGLYTSGVAIGALVYVLSSCLVFGLIMITNPFVLGVVCFFIVAVTCLTVYRSHLIYLKQKTKIDLLAIISGIVIAAMTFYVGLWVQVVSLTVFFMIGYLIKIRCFFDLKNLDLLTAATTFAIANSVLGVFFLTILKRPAEFILTLKYSDHSNYPSNTLIEIVIELAIILAINAISLTLTTIRFKKFRGSQTVLPPISNHQPV